MRSIEERLRTYGKSAVCRPDESKIKDTIVISRKSFYEGAEQSEPHYFAFLYEQMGYIRKRWWLLQFLVLFLTGWSVHDLESGFYMQRILGIEAALFVIMVIPEMWKSRSSYSLEVEGAAYYSLRQIYAARMLAFGVVDIGLLSAFTVAVSVTASVQAKEMVVYFFLPFTGACCILFRALCSRMVTTQIGTMSLALLWTAVWLFVVTDEQIYQKVSVPVWGAALLLAALYLGYAVKKSITMCENFAEVGI